MAELISREAAIEAIEEERRGFCMLSPGFGLPLKAKLICEGLIHAIQDVKEVPSIWISVKDRLPEVNEENGNIFFMNGLQGRFRSVLACYVDCGGKTIVEPLSFYVDRSNTPHWTVYNNVFHDFPFRVSRWMPFPDAPPE